MNTFMNLRNDVDRYGSTNWWVADVADATGTYYTVGAIWAKDSDGAAAKFERIAAQWADYTHDPEASAKMVERIREDYATRTYHGD